MYESFFDLAERPFTLRPDPAFLYLSPKHALALSMLEYGLTGQTGFVVVTGEIGSGKTTIIRRFLKRVDRKTIIGVISNTHVSFGDVLQWVLQAFDIKAEATDKATRYQAFVSYLVKQYAAGYQVVLLVDEAQNLTVEALEELRLLSNINTDKDQLLQIILVGQPELLESLKRPELRQFAQRISVHYHLSPLTYAETCGYIRHRLSVAGASREIFDPYAMGALYYFTEGVPRLINSICDMALVYAFAESKPVIDIDLILSVVRDREQGGLQALARTTADITREALIDQTNKSFGQPEPQRVSEPEPVDPMELETAAIDSYDDMRMIDQDRGYTRDRDRAPSWQEDFVPTAHPDYDSRLSSERYTEPLLAPSYLRDDDPYQPRHMPRRKFDALRWIRKLV